MNIAELLKAAWKSLLGNKLRSLLTMLGVIIGVAAVIIMIAVSAGTEASISDAITGLGSNLVFVRSNFMRVGPGMVGGSSSGLVYDDMTAIGERVNGVAGVTVEQSTTSTVSYNGSDLEDITIVGATPDYPTVRELKVQTGRFYNEREQERTTKVAVLGSALAEELFGDQDPIGEVIVVGSNVKLTVIGVIAPRGLVSGVNFDNQVYVPISIIFKKLSVNMFARFMGDRVNQIIVSVKPDSDVDTVVQQITFLLVKRHELTVDTADFTVSTQEDIIATQESATASFRTLLAWVAGVSLIVGGIGIMNIMLVSVTERTREIGLRQAVGATPGDIQTQFLSEALMLSLLGGLLGVAGGISGSYLFGSLSGMRTVILPQAVLLSFTSAALIGIIFGFLPAQQAARMDPIVALRHE